MKGVQAFAEIAEEPQERAEDLGKASQSALRKMKRRMEEMAKKLDKVDDKIQDFTNQQMEEIKRAVNRKMQDNVKAVARYGVELATAERRIKTEKK